ncbi:hypothetical protein LV84_03083 [Algoriphagus ratkowskyi]|uniref:Uncharacterized protein n=1 Tax=Algoriphagus ratkowskyi TaxID=57028 RepID=A0A2W7RSY6_9BACT|nr:hypothetical protein [Algoriphagus ratkowskyi]PZX53975.1 hypothetical protein LV84_03083 [Algoriphagus ratkowskyi]TXD76626.1 hypothetical protein ESW18_14785 [Algoriphagus ratkowskyi]
MSALSQTKPASVDQLIGLSSGYSKVSVNQQEIVKIFNQKSGLVMQGMCKFDESFEFLFPLFKGLSEAGKPRSLNLSFASSEKAVYFHYPESNQSEVSSFFSQLILHLQNEVRFKKVLKEIIRHRKHFLSEQILLQNAIMGRADN